MVVDPRGYHRLKFDYIEDVQTPDALARTAASTLIGRSWNGAPGAIRTPDLLVRSQLLYPAELRAHIEPSEWSSLRLQFLKDSGFQRPNQLCG